MDHFFTGFRSELLKLAFHEGWGLGGEWSTYAGTVNADTGPLMHEQGKPPDVEYKNARADYFRSLLMPPEEGEAGKKGRFGEVDGQRR